MLQPPDNLIYDSLEDFPLGINYGLSPFLIDRKQLALATNATVRGGFVQPRPPYYNQTLTFPAPDIQGSIQQLLQSGLFQGACYYQPPTGSEQLAAQIGGRMLLFTPNIAGINVGVKEITIPGDPNDSGITQVWPDQADQFLIVQDGQDLPFIYDGVSSRRSNPNTTVLGTLSADFNTPGLNGEVLVSLQAPYSGTYGDPVQLFEYDTYGNVVRVSNYIALQAVAGTSVYNLTLENLTDQAISEPINTNLVISKQQIGKITAISQVAYYNGSAYVTGYSITLDNPYGVQAAIRQGHFQFTFSSTGAQLSQIKLETISGNTFIVTSVAGQNYPQYKEPKVNDFCYGPAANNATVGTLANAFTVPPIGSTVPVTLAAPFSGAVNNIVTVGSGQYQVVSFGTGGVTGTSLLIQNIDDGITGYTNPGTSTFPCTINSVPEIPIGKMWAYGQGRIWTSLPDGFSFVAGDIVGGASGSPQYKFKDAILKMTENNLISQGGAFYLPSSIGGITAMRFTAQLDASLGQGPMMVVTHNGIYSCNAPTDRTTWQNLTTPIVSEALIGLGGQGQQSCIVVNGDLLFRSIDGIRSLIMARREFWSWGNSPISFEVQSILNADDPTLLPWVSAVQFDNRMLMTCTPLSGPQGVYFTQSVALNFDPVSSLQGKGASVYDGIWNGLNILQVIEGVFSGIHRCFAFVYNASTGIGLVELMKQDSGLLDDNGTTPITWGFQTPVVFRKKNDQGYYDIISLEDGEFYLAGVENKAVVSVQYQPDYSTQWFQWRRVLWDKAYGSRIGLGRPEFPSNNTVAGTTSSFGRWMQLQFTITGSCVFMGLRVSASTQPKGQFAKAQPNYAGP